MGGTCFLRTPSHPTQIPRSVHILYAPWDLSRVNSGWIFRGFPWFSTCAGRPDGRIVRTYVEHRLKIHRTCVEQLSLSNIYRKSVDTYIDHLPGGHQRVCTEHLPGSHQNLREAPKHPPGIHQDPKGVKVYRRFVEHLSNIYRTSTDHILNIY